VSASQVLVVHGGLAVVGNPGNALVPVHPNTLGRSRWPVMGRMENSFRWCASCGVGERQWLLAPPGAGSCPVRTTNKALAGTACLSNDGDCRAFEDKHGVIVGTAQPVRSTPV
jgi:hypothetical protein